ncbi:unnamed protein product [Protopolystoma xenopodis]|uniref:Uncharacterized protein n=1 Tax=Protopolystoma xenopodis TaxID=117903 RepID=A0A3S4ZUN8_9PLAT|nr:unnamed protein product [Protopolystoma xenopodis]
MAQLERSELSLLSPNDSTLLDEESIIAAKLSMLSGDQEKNSDNATLPYHCEPTVLQEACKTMSAIEACLEDDWDIESEVGDPG